MNVTIHHRGEDFPESGVSLSEQESWEGSAWKTSEGPVRNREDEEVTGSLCLFIMSPPVQPSSSLSVQFSLSLHS